MYCACAAAGGACAGRLQGDVHDGQVVVLAFAVGAVVVVAVVAVAVVLRLQSAVLAFAFALVLAVVLPPQVRVVCETN